MRLDFLEAYRRWYCYHVTFTVGTEAWLRSAQVHRPIRKIRTNAHLEEIKQDIFQDEGLPLGVPIHIVSWQRLPGEDLFAGKHPRTVLRRLHERFSRYMERRRASRVVWSPSGVECEVRLGPNVHSDQV